MLYIPVNAFPKWTCISKQNTITYAVSRNGVL